MHGNYYGTSRVWIEEQMKNGHDVLLEIDWQGALQVKKQFRNAVGIFILPPSLDALEERLKKRGQDEPNVITRRLLAAGSEIAHASEAEFSGGRPGGNKSVLCTIPSQGMVDTCRPETSNQSAPP